MEPENRLDVANQARMPHGAGLRGVVMSRQPQSTTGQVPRREAPDDVLALALGYQSPGQVQRAGVPADERHAGDACQEQAQGALVERRRRDEPGDGEHEDRDVGVAEAAYAAKGLHLDGEAEVLKLLPDVAGRLALSFAGRGSGTDPLG